MAIAACNQYKNFNGIFYIYFPTKSLKFGVRFALTLRLHSGRPHAARGYHIGPLRPRGSRANFLQWYAVFITIWLLYFFLLMTQGYAYHSRPLAVPYTPLFKSFYLECSPCSALAGPDRELPFLLRGLADSPNLWRDRSLLPRCFFPSSVLWLNWSTYHVVSVFEASIVSYSSLL